MTEHDSPSSKGSPQQNRRKREGSQEGEQPPSKRNSYHPVSVKCLVPHQIAGKLLGRGGDKMRQLKEVAPKLFMSKNDEYFPQTDERVLFIGGTIDQVHEVLGVVQEKIVGATQDVNSHQLPPKWRLNQMKLVVANSTCSKIIGNKGEVINQIRERTDTKITTTPLKQIIGNERVITLSGENRDVMEALRQILALVEEDKDARLQNDVSYKKFAHPYISAASTAASAPIFSSAAPTNGLGPNPYQLNFNPAAAAAWVRPGWENSMMQNMFANGGMPGHVPNGAGPSNPLHPGHLAAAVEKQKQIQVPLPGSVNPLGAAANPLELLGAAAASLGAAAASGNNSVVANNAQMIECLGGLIAQIARQQRLNSNGN